ncbi:MAG: MarR family transcriptional regulator [Eubacteriales bacterium]
MRQEDHLLHYFKKMHDKVEKQGNASLKEIGLTLAQGHILGYLHHSEGYMAPLKEIERRMKVAQSTTAGMVSRLEHNGFVETKEDSVDKRIKIVVLTERGLESTQYIKASMDEIQNQVLSNLTDEEKESLMELLKKVTKD